VEQQLPPPNREVGPPAYGRRVVFVSTALAILIIAGLFFVRTWTNKPRPSAPTFPLTIYDKEPAIPDLPADILLPALSIKSVSADRKWLCLLGPSGQGAKYFFDLQQRRIVAGWEKWGLDGSWRTDVRRGQFILSHEGIEPILAPGWTSERFIVEQAEGGEEIGEPADELQAPPFSQRLRDLFRPTRTTRYESFYELDVRARRMRLIFGEATQPPQEFNDWEVCPNKTLTLICCSVTHDKYDMSYDSDPLNDYRVYDRATGRQYDIPADHFELSGNLLPAQLWGWMPDERTLVFCQVSKRSGPSRSPQTRITRADNLYLLDVAGDAGLRKVPVAEPFERLRKKGGLGSAEGELGLFDLVGFVEQGRRARFAVTFCTTATLYTLSDSVSSVWDLDLETGELKRVMDLPRGTAYSAYNGTPLFSPSLDSILVPMPPVIATTQRFAVLPTSLTLYTVGQPPRTLPLSFTTLYRGNQWGARPLLRCGLCFLDEQTLVYADVGYELWAFDLQTNKSALLWRANASNNVMPSGEGPVYGTAR